MLWGRDHAKLVIVFFILSTLFFGYFLKDIKIDASPGRLMVPGTPELEFYNKTKEMFGSDNVTVVYIKDKNLFSYKKLKVIEELFFRLQDIKGVGRVDSIFNAKNFKSIDGSLSTNPFLDPVPEDPKQIEQVKEDALKNPILNGIIVRSDGLGLAINVIADPDPKDEEFDVKLANAVDAAIEPTKGKVDEVWQIGTPLTRRLITKSLIDDQFTLVPIAIIILMGMILMCLRSFHGAVIPLLGGIISCVWTVGLMSILHVPIHVLTVVIPSILLVIGSAEDMHLTAEYYELLDEGKLRKVALDIIAKALGLAVLFTALTTVIGFGSVAINEMPLLKEFGWMSAIGIVISFIVTLIFNPAYLMLFGSKGAEERAAKKLKSNGLHSAEAHSKAHGEETAHKQEHKTWFDIVANIALHIAKHYKIHSLVVCILLVVASIIGMTLIQVDNDLLGYFKPRSEIRVKSQRLHEELTGAQNFFIVLTSEEEGTFKKPTFLKKISEIQAYLKQNKSFDNSLSLSNQIALVHREMNEGRSEMYQVPDEENLISQYLLLFTQEEIDRYVTSDFKNANIVVRHNLSSSYEQKIALEALQKAIQRILSGTKIQTQFTSESILINNAADSIASGQAQSLGITLGIIFILMSILFVNFKAGLLSVIPALIPIFILFGVMGFFGIPLNPGTSMVADIAIGIAVDNTTHLMVRYYHSAKGEHKKPWDIIAATVRSETRPMLTTTIALTLAFMSLAVSNFVPLIYFGMLSGMVLAIALIADLVITPMLLTTTSIIPIWEILGLHLHEKVLHQSPLFEGMKPWQIKKLVLSGTTKTFQEGELIIKKGVKERFMYVILNGQVRVETLGKNKENVTLGYLSHGEIFGEIALVNEVERTANVITTSAKTEVLQIDWESLEKIKKAFPVISSTLFFNISRVLGLRLANMDQVKATAFSEAVASAQTS